MEVKSIDYLDTKEWLLYKHYAKRMPSISYSFGLFNNGVLIGVCTFGVPASTPIRVGFEPFRIIELNRLCVNDGLPKNSLSTFVSKCFNFLPKPLVLVSYADTSMNHNGYIYQATNWIYTGLSAKVKEYAIKGMEHLHCQTIFDLSKGQENRAEWLREKYGDDLYMRWRPQKHRYFYFLGSKKQKKKMLKMLPYNIEPYPKGLNTRYDSSYKPHPQLKIF